MIHPAREESGWVSSGPGDRSSEPQPRRNRATGQLPRPSFPRRHPGTFRSPEKSEGKWPEGARPGAGARERCLVATRRGRTRKDMFPRPRADRARFAAKTRRIDEGCRADEEGCSTRSTHLFAEKNGGPTPSFHAAVRRRRTSGLPVKATQVSLAVSRARKGDNRPIHESARTPPTYTPDRFRCAKKLWSGVPDLFAGKGGPFVIFQFFFPYGQSPGRSFHSWRGKMHVLKRDRRGETDREEIESRHGSWTGNGACFHDGFSRTGLYARLV